MLIIKVDSGQAIQKICLVRKKGIDKEKINTMMMKKETRNESSCENDYGM